MLKSGENHWRLVEASRDEVCIESKHQDDKEGTWWVVARLKKEGTMRLAGCIPDYSGLQLIKGKIKLVEE